MSKNKAIHQLGQYFTTDETLQNTVFELIRKTGIADKAPIKILEPSVGRGHLLLPVIKRMVKPITITCYEIDKTVEFLFDTTEQLKNNISLIYGDFLAAKINSKFHVIIGNPPYVKTKTSNLYLDFIDKCYSLLEDNGEMIMIVPSNILTSTAGTSLRNKLLTGGSITDIIHPNKERLFTAASIDIIIFRYQKSITSNIVNFNGERKLLINNGVFSFEDTTNTNCPTRETCNISDIFDIYVGIVSGAEDVFKIPFGNISVRNSEDDTSRYILIKSFPCKSKKINEHLLKHKNRLLSRRIRNFTELNWFEWGALRNISKMDKYKGSPCIYIKSLTRQNTIAFRSTVGYFGGSLLMLIPKQLTYAVDLDDFVAYFNSDNFKKKHMQSGRFKIGHRQLGLARVIIE